MRHLLTIGLACVSISMTAHSATINDVLAANQNNFNGVMQQDSSLSCFMKFVKGTDDVAFNMQGQVNLGQFIESIEGPIYTDFGFWSLDESKQTLIYNPGLTLGEFYY